MMSEFAVKFNLNSFRFNFEFIHSNFNLMLSRTLGGIQGHFTLWMVLSFLSKSH